MGGRFFWLSWIWVLVISLGTAGCNEELPLEIVTVALDIAECFEPIGQGGDGLCAPAVEERFVQGTGACLAWRSGERKGVLPFYFDVPTGSLRLVGGGPIEVRRGNALEVKLFMLAPGEDYHRCMPADYHVNASCEGDDAVEGCLFAFSKVVSDPVEGTVVPVVLGAGSWPCGIECNDSCDQVSCTRLCWNDQYPYEERCDGRDNTCNGMIDDGFDVGEPCIGVGQCGAGLKECAEDGLRTICSTLPGGSDDQSAPEVCDGQDNSCDGTIDNVGGDDPSCETGLPGICSEGVLSCDGVEGPEPACVQLHEAQEEVCDGLDNSCDGMIDNVGGDDPTCHTGLPGICSEGVLSCEGAQGLEPICVPLNEPQEEVCDGLDNNCDGRVDEDFDIVGGECINRQEVDCESPHPDTVPDNAHVVHQAVEITYTDAEGWTAADLCSWRCNPDHDLLEGECLQRRMVACSPLEESQVPPNGFSLNQLVEVTYTDGGGWTDPDPCPWSCLPGYDRLGDACANQRMVSCRNVAPLNATSSEDMVQILYQEEDGEWIWSVPDPCDWACNQGYVDFFDDGQCINTRQEWCSKDEVPQGAISDDILVTIDYALDEGQWAWSDPDPCEWQCELGLFPVGNACLQSVLIEDCKFHGPVSSIALLESSPSFTGKVFVEGGPLDEVAAQAIRAKVCGAADDSAPPLVPGEGDWSCVDAVSDGIQDGWNRVVGHLAFSEVAQYQLIYMFSGDGGDTWSVCDQDGTITPESDPNPGTVISYAALANGGFEEWDGEPLMPTGWNVFNDLVPLQESEIVKSGTYSLKLSKTKTSGQWMVSTMVPVIGGEVTYKMSAQVFGCDSVTSNIILVWYDVNGDKISFRTTVLDNCASSWTEFTRQMVFPADAAYAGVQIFLRGTDHPTSDDIYFDDLTILPVLLD